MSPRGALVHWFERSLVLWFVGSLLASASEKYTYWIAPCDHAASLCQPGDPQLAEWAFESWRKAAGGALKLERVTQPGHARIRLVWATAEGGLYGEARPVMVDGQRGAEVYVRPAPLDTSADQLLRDTIVYLTCLHETGHALGLPHTASFDDIMYSFQYGGDIPEYFARYRRKLARREDIRTNSGLSDADRGAIRKSILDQRTKERVN